MTDFEYTLITITSTVDCRATLSSTDSLVHDFHTTGSELQCLRLFFDYYLPNRCKSHHGNLQKTRRTSAKIARSIFQTPSVTEQLLDFVVCPSTLCGIYPQRDPLVGTDCKDHTEAKSTSMRACAATWAAAAEKHGCDRLLVQIVCESDL